MHTSARIRYIHLYAHSPGAIHHCEQVASFGADTHTGTHTHAGSRSPRWAETSALPYTVSLIAEFNRGKPAWIPTVILFQSNTPFTLAAAPRACAHTLTHTQTSPDMQPTVRHVLWYAKKTKQQQQHTFCVQYEYMNASVLAYKCNTLCLKAWHGTCILDP